MDADYLSVREEELFDRWRERRKPFISDGLVDPKKYVASNPKIVFVLKEVNDPGGKEEWDLRSFLRKGGRGRTWNNIVRWALGMQKFTCRSWSDFKSISEAQRKEALTSIGVINVKKTPGGASSKSEEINYIARKDSDLLEEQLELYKPNFLICCGWLGHLFPQLEKLDWCSTERGVVYCKLAENRFAVRYYHPQVRWPDHLLFFTLMDAIDELSAGGGWPSLIPEHAPY